MRAATRLGVWMVNVHASGGGDMMRAAREAAAEEAERRSSRPPLVIAVTMLTSLIEAALPEIGVSAPVVTDQVERLARLAQASGLDGVVASPQEIEIIRRRCGQPVRDRHARHPGRGAASDDQSRTMTRGRCACRRRHAISSSAGPSSPPPIRARPPSASPHACGATRAT